ncbi:MAG TPA: DUF1330 domain-containing protein [Gammaproteobacteria bacterium]|nr:DUF1330 domain-containing protein [Gammaproteobacteria bacterium]
MKAYCIFDVREIVDGDKLEAYTRDVLATVQAHGGCYLSVGGNCRVLEGSWSPEFLVLIEFPGIEQARSWYESDDYAALKRLRQQGSRGDAVMIEPEESALRDHLVGGD